MLAIRGQRDRAYVSAAAERQRNDEIRMTKLEQFRMIKRSHHLLSGFVLRPSFVIRHSCFVIVLALGIGTALAEKRPITEKDLWDFVWFGDPQVSPDGSR